MTRDARANGAFLGLDIGTSAVKALLVDADQRVLAEASATRRWSASINSALTDEVPMSRPRKVSLAPALSTICPPTLARMSFGAKPSAGDPKQKPRRCRRG